MADDRCTYLHHNEAIVHHLGTAEDELDDFDLPPEEIDAPRRLVPRYQAEEDEALPSHTHPSYPFGNPYSFSSYKPAHTFVSKHSLATTLPVLSLPKGMPLADTQWNDVGFDQLLSRTEIEESRKEDVDFNKAADQVAREGEEAQHRAANDLPNPNDSGREA